MIVPDPFAAPDLFVGRDHFVARLTTLLSVGNSVLLLGGKHTGKTRLASRLTPEGLGRQILWADTHGWDTSTAQTAFGDLRTVLEQREPGSYATASREAVTKAAKMVAPFTLIIDDADRLLRHAWCGDFFSLLRFFDDTALRTDISVMLIGGPVLADYRDRENDNSPPLGNATVIPLEPLADTAVQSLIDLMAPDRRPELSVVMELGGGQPWLTTSLLSRINQGSTVDEATRLVFEGSIRTFRSWERQLGEDARLLLHEIPRKGRPADTTGSRRQATELTAVTVGVLRIGPDGATCSPKLFYDWFRSREPSDHVWDVAISYAPADEAQAARLAEALHARYDVFFAPSQEAQLWQPDRLRQPPGLYQAKARCIVVLSTKLFVSRYWNSAWRKRPDLLIYDQGRVPRRTAVKRVRPDPDGGIGKLCAAIDLIHGRNG